MVKILADSTNTFTGDRITTFLVSIWKVLQAELRTHRSTGQSHYSSRAIPTDKLIKQVEENPFIPLWREFQKGMSGSNTLLEKDKKEATEVWRSAAKSAIWHVNRLKELGIAKEQRNRLLEPFMTGDCIVTASGYAWSHFFNLRCAEGVQPEFREVAEEMLIQYHISTPKLLNEGEWHIAFEDKNIPSVTEKLQVSVARCARTSYLNHQSTIDYLKDFELYQKLLRHTPPHLSCFEHQLQAQRCGKYAQYTGFKPLRIFIEDGESYG
jgi:hypothetical protein